MKAKSKRSRLRPPPPDSAPFSEQLSWLAEATERLARQREAAGLAEQAEVLRTHVAVLRGLVSEFEEHGE